MSVTEFTIKRSGWMRGVKWGSVLLVSERVDHRGKRCCMGYLASACQVPDDYLSGVSLFGFLPVDQTSKLPSLLRPTLRDEAVAGLTHDETGLAGQIYTINDNDKITEQEREARLTDLFKQAGLTVHFED